MTSAERRAKCPHEWDRFLKRNQCPVFMVEWTRDGDKEEEPRKVTFVRTCTIVDGCSNWPGYVDENNNVYDLGADFLHSQRRNHKSCVDLIMGKVVTVAPHPEPLRKHKWSVDILQIFPPEEYIYHEPLSLRRADSILAGLGKARNGRNAQKLMDANTAAVPVAINYGKLKQWLFDSDYEFKVLEGAYDAIIKATAYTIPQDLEGI